MTRRAVVHQDDVGMCHGANVAFIELSAIGAVTSGSVMVPCPWFPEIAAAAVADHSLDLGVHLTLTAEKDRYRWGPISGPPPSSGLTDGSGYFWPDVTSLRRHADPEAVGVELRAQVDRALAAGIDVTHLDAHMGAVLAPELASTYLALGAEYDVPVVITGSLAGYAPNNHLEGVDEASLAPFVDQARAAGHAIFDVVVETPWGRRQPAEAAYRTVFERIPDGLSFLALHPNAPGELTTIEPDTAHIRIDEYDLLRSETFRQWLAAQHLELIGMRTLRDEFRARR